MPNKPIDESGHDSGSRMQLDDEGTRVRPRGRSGQDVALFSAWLNRFTQALNGEYSDLRSLFVADSWWRDSLAFTWDLRTFRGVDQIDAMLTRRLREVRPRNFCIRPPTEIVRTDDYLEAQILFETAVGRGQGVVRLVEDRGEMRCWTILTDLAELTGFEEGRTRLADMGDPRHYETVLGRPTWHDMRATQREFVDQDPVVLVVGGGHSGLMLAARLGRLGVAALVVDRHGRIGDSWRTRYDNLFLHDTMWCDQFPYLPFPSNWPLFPPKDMVADFLESYAWMLQLNVWTSAAVQSARFDANLARWEVDVRRGEGESRTVRPRHLVFATGRLGAPAIPELAGIDGFGGRIVHSTDVRGSTDTAGKRVVVVGSGTSAHDICQGAVESRAASVTMVQRGPTYVMSASKSLAAVLADYHEDGPPVDITDLISMSWPLRLAVERAPSAVERMAKDDHDLLAGLERAGFRLTFGDDGSGALGISLRRSGGFYIDKGGSQLLIDGRVALRQGGVARLTETAVVCGDGTSVEADVVVFATGYSSMTETLRPILGDAIADTLPALGTADPDGELSGFYREVGHRQLWYMPGRFQQSRIGSRQLALQILAREHGLTSWAPHVMTKEANDAGFAVSSG